MDRGQVGPGPDLVGLQDALASKDASARATALLRIPNVPGAEELVVAALADPSAEVRRAAVQALARMAGPHAITSMMHTAAHDPAPAVRAEAVGALARLIRGRSEPGR